MKTIKFLVLLTINILSSAFLEAQTVPVNDQPYIEVTGVAEKEVIPDEIYIGVTLKEKYEEKVKISIEEQEEKLKSALQALGIDLKNLQISDISADYVKVYHKTKDVITNKNYTVMVKDATTAGKVFMELDKLDITDARITRVWHSKLDSIKKEMRIEAIKAAKEKADYLLGAIGELAGKPLIIKETEPTYYVDNNVFVSNSYSGASSNNSQLNYFSKVLNDGDVEFQKIRVKASTYVKFSIK